MRFFIRFSYRPLIVKILKIWKKIQDDFKKHLMFSRKENDEISWIKWKKYANSIEDWSRNPAIPLQDLYFSQVIPAIPPPFTFWEGSISILGRFSAKIDVSVDFGLGNLHNFLILKKNLLNKLSDRLMWW